MISVRWARGAVKPAVGKLRVIVIMLTLFFSKMLYIITYVCRHYLQTLHS